MKLVRVSKILGKQGKTPATQVYSLGEEKFQWRCSSHHFIISTGLSRNFWVHMLKEWKENILRMREEGLDRFAGHRIFLSPEPVREVKVEVRAVSEP